MISKEFIDSDLGSVLAALGKECPNASFWADYATEEEIMAKKAELDAAKASAQAQVSAYDAFIKEGFDTGLGFTLAVAKDDQTAISNLMTGLKNKGPANTSTWTLKDINGKKQEVTYEQFKKISDSYFDYVYGAWKSL